MLTIDTCVGITAIHQTPPRPKRWRSI